jgi:hypothetical protein
MGSIFCQILYDYKISGNDIELDELFKSFDSPIDKLKNICDIEIVDNKWFEEIKKQKEIGIFANELIKKYTLMRKRKKYKGAALHDALILYWIKTIRQDNNKNNVWLITIDTTLPGIVPDGSSSQSFAITLPALLQWISPISLNKDQKDFTLIFSEILKYRLLPPENFFELNDFLILDELNISCNQLPTEDVEDCLRYIRTQLPMLDPYNLKDRETLSYNVSKFFADPGRKYNRELSELRKDLAELTSETNKWKDEVQKEKEVREKEKLKVSAIIRLIITCFIFIFLEPIAFYLIYIYGEGENLFQKIASSYWYLIVPFGIFLLSGWAIIGKRLKFLHPFFQRIFKK